MSRHTRDGRPVFSEALALGLLGWADPLRGRQVWREFYGDGWTPGLAVQLIWTARVARRSHLLREAVAWRDRLVQRRKDQRRRLHLEGALERHPA